tara:strand:+ start:8160 stop:8378 length:219 start_codon:yes stop_codon:yes gene_type:complete
MEEAFLALEGDFTVKTGQTCTEYHKISDIPEKFDHLIKFLPNIPPSPHSEADHEHMGNFTDYIHMLQAREQK